jgi:hypothetical protein
LRKFFRHPELIDAWKLDLQAHGDWTMLIVASGLIFPKLALGMSGFETGVSVMPLVSAKTNPDRIRATRPSSHYRGRNHECVSDVVECRYDIADTAIRV